MCLAIPAKVIEIKQDRLATVDILGVTRDISIDLTPQAGVGDFVLVHAGFAIEVVDPDYAQETIDLIKDFPDLIGDEFPLAEAPAPADDELPLAEALAPVDGTQPLEGSPAGEGAAR